MNSDLELALSLADDADEITLKFFQTAGLSVRTKSDRSPVSEADEAVEQMIRDRLGRERPGDGIVGEEFGTSGPSPRRWIIDPIDATRNYVRGVPVYATLLALEENGKLVIGVVSAPAMGQRWWASSGGGSFCNGRPIAVSPVQSVSEAFLAYDSVPDFEPLGLSQRFLDLVYACDRSRGFGDFWAHMLVAEGAVDLAVEPRVALWDVAAVQIIVEEAGGRFTNLAGEARPDGNSALSTNGHLHEEALRFFR